jgi:hypothetical protein
MFVFFIIIILLEGCRWIGGLYIKYLFYVNGYSLGSFNTPNYYLLGFFGGVGGLYGSWRTGYNVFVVHKCVFIEKLVYTQLLLVFWGGKRGGGLDIFCK